MSFLKKYNLAPFITLVILMILCCYFNPVFKKPEFLLNIANQCAPVGLIALGMTLVIAGGGIDLSVGSLFALSGVIGVVLMNHLSGYDMLGHVQTGDIILESAFLTLLICSIVAFAVGATGGAINGALVNYGKIPPFIATLGTYSIFRSIAIFLPEAGTLYSYNTALDSLSTGCVPVAILLVAALIFFVIVKFTKLGWRICAVGSNEKSAVYAGINIKSIRLISYIIIGLLCGVATILQLSRLHSVPSTTSGGAYELDAIAAVIIGGTPMTGGRAYIGGTICGIFILAIISNLLLVCNINANLFGTVKGIIIILAVLLQYKRDAK